MKTNFGERLLSFVLFFLDQKKIVDIITCPVLRWNTCQRSNVGSAGQFESFHVKHVDVAVVEWNVVVRWMVPDLCVSLLEIHGRKETQKEQNIEHYFNNHKILNMDLLADIRLDTVLCWFVFLVSACLTLETCVVYVIFSYRFRFLLIHFYTTIEIMNGYSDQDSDYDLFYLI